MAISSQMPNNQPTREAEAGVRKVNKEKRIKAGGWEGESKSGISTPALKLANRCLMFNVHAGG
jgi:hypothetical protein